jgi:RimJ/RimL family protein N-acetyltransferase
LPSLTGALVTLRELRLSDASSLFSALTGVEVSRFISPPPYSVDGFEKFIEWTHRQREAGQCICFAVMPKGTDNAIGLFQVRSLEPAFGTAEWGFAIANEFWGTGMFLDGARLVLDFAFDVIGVHPMEARSTLRNSSGNGALLNLGAVQ